MPNHAVSNHGILLQDLLDQIDLGIHVYHLEDTEDDRSLRMIYVNPAAEEYTGLKGEDVLGRTLDDNFPGLREIGIPQIYAQVVRSGKPIDIGTVDYGDERIQENSFFVKAFPLAGNYVGISFRNITREVNAEKERRKMEETFQKVFQISPLISGISELDSGRFIKVNQTFCDKLGFIQKEVVGRLSTDIIRFDPKQREMLRDRLKKNGRLQNEASVIYTKHGVPLDVLFFSELIEIAGKTYNYATALDVTEMKRMERRISHSSKMEALGTLAGGIAHDFNNILYPIIGFTEMMLDDAPLGGVLRENLEEVLTAALRAGKLVRHLSSFSAEIEIERKPLRIQLIIKEVLKFVRSIIPEIIQIRQQIDSRCPPVVADPGQIHHLALGLISNAFQAMKTGKGILTVSVQEQRLTPAHTQEMGLEPGTYVCLVVSDTGPGVDPDLQDRLLEPYAAAFPPEEGDDLSLAVLYNIVTNSSGRILVDSHPGEGTTFRCYFPAIDEQAILVGEERLKRSHPIPAHGRILLVDDEAQVVKMGKRMLEGLGYAVTLAENGVAAVEIFSAKGESFDLVITDQDMPQMSGEELTRRIRKIDPQIPVLLCTGFSDPMSDLRLKASGISGVLRKPIVKSRLIQVIQKVLESKDKGGDGHVSDFGD